MLCHFKISTYSTWALCAWRCCCSSCCCLLRLDLELQRNARNFISRPLLSNSNNINNNFKPGGGGVRADGDAECHEEDDEEEPQEDLNPVVAPPGAVGHRLHAGLAQERLRKNSNFEFYFIFSIVWVIRVGASPFFVTRVESSQNFAGSTRASSTREP